MVKFVLNKVRYLLGNTFGFILFLFVGKKILLSKIDRNRVLAIYFHNPSVIVFETIIKWLVKYDFNIIAIKEFQESFKRNECKSKRTVFISFDDAWSGNIDLIPIIEKYNIPIIVFVTTQAIQDGQIWLNIVRKKFDSIENKIKLGINVSDIKSIPHSKAIELYKAALNKGPVKREIMTREELVNFSKWVSIGSHTVTHPILINCEDEVIKFELNKSDSTLKSWGLNVNKTFAYPNGSFNTNVVSILRETKYEYAFTTKAQIIELNTDNNYTIPRICIPDNFGKYENLARMSGIWSKIFKD